MLLPKVIALLDQRGIRYEACRFGASLELKEIEHIAAGWGMGWIKSVPLEVDGNRLALAVIPASLDIDPLALSSRFAPRSVRFLTEEQFTQIHPDVHPHHLPPLGDLLGAEVYLSPLVEKYLTVGFSVDSPYTYIKLSSLEFRRLQASAKDLPVPTRPRYRAYAAPLRKSLESCILGISLENPAFHTAKLVTIVHWIKRKGFKSCLVLLGDGLHRITLQMELGMPETLSLEHSKWLARDFVHTQQSVFGGGDSDPSFSFVYCSDIQKTQEYLAHYQAILALYGINQCFRDSFHEFADLFVARRPVLPEHRGRLAAMSRQYLLEELAVFACLARDSPRTFIYPGSLTILDEIASGKHPDVPAGLLEMDYVELKIKRH